MTTLDMTWFDASDMMENGLVDQVLDTGERVGGLDLKQPLSNLYQIYNSIIKKDTDMSLEKVKAKLGIENTASEDVVVNKIGEIQADAGKVGELETTNKTLSDENKALKKQRGKTLIDNAVEKGLIEADKRSSWDDQAVSNYEGTKSMIDSITPSQVGSGTPASVSDDLVENNGSEKKAKASAKFTAEEETEIAKGAKHLVENNWQLYNKLARTEPDRFSTLKN